MKKSITALVIVFLLCSCNKSVQPEELSTRKLYLEQKKEIPSDFIPRNWTIVAAGDSLSKGIGGVAREGGYIPYLKSKMEKQKEINKVNFSNYGVKGNRSTQLLNRLQSPDLQKTISKTDIVIVTIGGNDLMKVIRENISNLQIKTFEREKLKFVQNLYRTFESIRKVNPNAVIVLVGLYNPFTEWFSDVQEMNEVVSSWNNAGREVTIRFNQSFFVDIEELFSTNDSLLYKDNFHPNDKGYELIADQIYQTLLKGEVIKKDRTT